MIGIFTLYLKDVEVGFSMTEKKLLDFSGNIYRFWYFDSFIGGLIVDRYLVIKNHYNWRINFIGYSIMGSTQHSNVVPPR